MNILRKIKKLFNRKTNSHTLSREKSPGSKAEAEIILTEKESAKFNRGDRQKRFSEWYKEHNKLKQ
jgi:hypothetical protein